MLRRQASLLAASFVPVAMPALCPNGRIIQWKKRVGDRVQPGDILAEVKTDTIIFSIKHASAEEGILGKIFVKDGEDATGDQVVAVLVKAEAELKNVDEYVPAPSLNATHDDPTLKKKMFGAGVRMMHRSSGRGGGYEVDAPPTE